jgi:hypothetical protein
MHILQYSLWLLVPLVLGGGVWDANKLVSHLKSCVYNNAEDVEYYTVDVKDGTKLIHFYYQCKSCSSRSLPMKNTTPIRFEAPAGPSKTRT